MVHLFKWSIYAAREIPFSDIHAKAPRTGAQKFPESNQSLFSKHRAARDEKYLPVKYSTFFTVCASIDQFTDTTARALQIAKSSPRPAILYAHPIEKRIAPQARATPTILSAV